VKQLELSLILGHKPSFTRIELHIYENYLVKSYLLN